MTTELTLQGAQVVAAGDDYFEGYVPITSLEWLDARPEVIARQVRAPREVLA